MIADSSSLIIFAKIMKLDILIKLYNQINITLGIFNEIVEEGLKIGASDAEILKKALEENKIKILPLDKKHQKINMELKRIYYQLGSGESEAIVLALQQKEKSIIMDDKLGRQVCKFYNMKPIGTLRVLLEAYNKNILDENSLREIITEITKHKFRIGADVINEFWFIFDKLKKRKT